MKEFLYAARNKGFFMWASIIPAILSIVSWFLDRAKASKETKEAFFAFVRRAANDVKSVKLHEWGDRQLAELKKQPWKESQ